MRQKRGFTLLEVMIAVAILGLGLTAILSAQAGAFSMSGHARNLGVATGLARCKMGELEEQLSKPDGFQELDVVESGQCCEDDDTPNVTCTWKIEKPVFPEPVYGEMELDTSLNLNGPSSTGLPVPGGNSIPTSLDGGLDNPQELLNGLVKEGMKNAYPTLKNIFENSSRRITVTVTWKEGIREHSFDVIQWFTRLPTQGLDPDALDGGPNG